tara:strand:- start:2057 stop:2227 length:171 start_codon:yes stop_codon:yes gene_type:complete
MFEHVGNADKLKRRAKLEMDQMLDGKGKYSNHRDAVDKAKLRKKRKKMERQLRKAS